MTQNANSESASRVLVALLEALGSKVAFVILRNYENLPDAWGNDVDVLIRAEDLKEVATISLEVLTEADCARSVQVLERHNLWSLCASCSDRVLRIDFFSAMSKAWLVYADTEAILAGAIRRHALFSTPEAYHELLLIAAKELFAFGHIRTRYHERLRDHDAVKSLDAARALFSKYVTEEGCSLIARGLVDPRVVGRPRVRARLLLQPMAMLRWLLQRGNRFHPLY
jgi:hypothetical protein